MFILPVNTAVILRRICLYLTARYIASQCRATVRGIRNIINNLKDDE